jgi:ribosomal protein S18 acetylase RimI-like enzyme
MTGFSFRPLYPEDLNQVAKIESSLTGSPRRAFLEIRLAMATANIGEVFLDETGDMPLEPQTMPGSFITCAALENKKLVGYGFARILEGEFGARSTIVELHDIGVAADDQGRGIGKRVMANIEQQMKRKNINTLQTQIDWSNIPMIRFFASAGFSLASGQIIERDTSPLSDDPVSPAVDEKWQFKSGGTNYDKHARGSVTVRPIKWEDLAAVDRIDVKCTGLDRSAYYAAKFREVLNESGVRVSMVAEDDGVITGFIMARVDFGEFGRVDKTAVIDTIGVHPAYGGSGVGHALLSQLLINLSDLDVESVRIKLEHENFALWNFLARRGFKPSQRLLLTKKIG